MKDFCTGISGYFGSPVKNEKYTTSIKKQGDK